MRITNITINIIEWMLIGLMGFCGTFSFINSNAYTLLQSPVASHYPGISPYLPDIIWSVIFLFGVQSIILRSKAGGTFTWLVVIFFLPSLLSYDSINIFNIFGITFNAITRINFYQLLGLGILIMIGYILLSHLSVLKQSRRALTKRQANPRDIEEVISRGYLFLLLAIVAALITVALLALIARGIEVLIFPLLSRLSWNLVLLGLGCVLVLAIYLYWLGSRRHSNS